MNETESSQPPKEVFVVDDETMILELVTLVLEPLGHHIHAFTKPKDALAAFTRANPAPDLVITDYNMHHMTGMDLIRECRRINPKQKTILYSGTVDDLVYNDSSIKPNRFLAKPFQPNQLIKLVSEVLAKN